MGSNTIHEKVQKALSDTTFACSDLIPIAGGRVNWSYCAKLRRPLNNGTAEVLIKHGEKYMSSKPDFELNLLRCFIESECYRIMSDCPFRGEAEGMNEHNIVVRTPQFIHYDERNTNQILEHLPDAITLRDLFMSNHAGSSAESLLPAFRRLGQATGDWLSKFTKWSAKHAELRQVAAKNGEVQHIRHMLSFLWLFDRVKEYPHILGEAKDVFEAVETSVAAELREQDNIQPIHGDFALGNLILPNVSFQKGIETPVFVIDWEMAQLGVPNTDLGHIVADLYAHWRLKSMCPALSMMEGLVHAYGEVTDSFAFRTALQVGSHLICLMPVMDEWLHVDGVEALIRRGRDIVVHASDKDRVWFENSDLSCLFVQVK